MKIVFEVVTDLANATAGIETFKKRVKDLNKEIASGKGTPSQMEAYSKDLVEAKNKIADLTAKQKELNRTFEQSRFPKDSIAGSRIEIRKLTDEYNALSKAARESAQGQKLAAQISSLRKTTTAATANTGQLSLSQTIDQSLSGLNSQNLKSLAVAGGIGAAIAGVKALADVMKLGIDTAVQYEQALDDLSALTGLQGPALQGLEQAADSLKEINVQGVEIVSTGTEILNAMKLVGGARPELLGNAQALADVTKQAIILSRASGDTLLSSVDALTTTLGQFQLTGADSTRVINELAAGAKVGSSEIPQTTDALKAFGTVANTVNVTTGESIALIETLADRQLKGAEAGTQLRNILSKLASADILPPKAQDQFRKLGIDVNILKDNTLSFETRLRELGKAQGDVAALTKIFGLENLTAANILTGSIDKFDQFKKGIEGTNEAFVQASVRSDNANTSFQNLKNKGLNELQETFITLTPILAGAADGLGFLFDKADVGSSVFKTLAGNLGIFVDVLKAVGNARNAPVRQFASAQDSLDAVFGNTPQGGDLLLQNIRKTAQQQSDAAVRLALVRGDQGEGGAPQTVDQLKAKIKDLKKELGGVEIGSERFRELKAEISDAQKELQKLIGKPGKGSDIGPEGSFSALKKAVEEARQALEKAPEFKIAGAVETLKKAEQELQVLQNRIETIRSGKAVTVRGATINSEAVTGGDIPESAIPGQDGTGLEIGTTDAQLEAAIENNLELVDNTEFTTEEILALEKALSDKKIGLTEEELKKRLELEEEAAKRRKELQKLGIDSAIQAAEDVASAVFQIDKNRLEKETDSRLSALDESYKKQIEAAEGNVDLQEQLQRELEDKKAAIEKEAANKRKELAKKEALINIALSIVKALTGAPPPANFILAGAAAVAGGAQLAIIENTQFAKGGFTGDGFDYRDSTGRRVAGVVHEKEYVAPESQIQRYPWIFDELERDRLANLRPFAAGGFTSTIVPNFPTTTATANSGFQQDFTGFTDNQVKILGANLGGIIGEVVGFEVKRQLAAGINDNNRLQERQNALTQSRKV